MKFKKQVPYDIMIRPTPNGAFIVEVGCVKVAYASREALLKDLEEYLTNPEEIEAEYNKDMRSTVHIAQGPTMLTKAAMEQMSAAYSQPEPSMSKEVGS